jgi:hypothetical protein
VPYAAAGQARLALLLACYAMFGVAVGLGNRDHHDLGQAG